MKKNNRRHTLIIDRERQIKITLTTIIYMLVTVLVVTTAVFFPSMVDLSGEMGQMEDYQLQAQAMAGREFAILHHRFWPAVLFVVILLGLHSLIILHRVFGPLYRLRLFLQKVATGDLTGRLEFRKQDYLSNEKAVVNNMLESLGEILDRVKSSNSSLEQSIASLTGECEKGETDASTIAAKIKDLSEKQAEFGKALDAIKTTGAGKP